MDDLKAKYDDTMWAEMKPDCYGGEECDQIEPRWYTYAAGDKEGGYEHEPLVLDAKLFPPGTKVVISEPHCPKCGDPRHPTHLALEATAAFASKCDCGFDWDAWVLEQYS